MYASKEFFTPSTKDIDLNRLMVQAVDTYGLEVGFERVQYPGDEATKIKIELYGVPENVEQFIELLREGHYDAK